MSTAPSTLSAIGVFDSGIGGLTVVKAIKNLLPNNKIIYFGDTAHLPYGDKSKEAIEHYSKRIGAFLADHGCKHIVIACNTASAFAYDALKEFLADRAEVFNVINPVVKYIAQKYDNKKVGIIGTRGTINSGIYPKKIKKLNPSIQSCPLATPLLAPMIEEGFHKNDISHSIISGYLSQPMLGHIDAIILACTHYPLIEQHVKNYYQNNVEVINSAKIVAEHIATKLARAEQMVVDSFYISDYTDAFQQSAELFLGEKIQLKKLNFW